MQTKVWIGYYRDGSRNVLVCFDPGIVQPRNEEWVFLYDFFRKRFLAYRKDSIRSKLKCIEYDYVRWLKEYSKVDLVVKADAEPFGEFEIVSAISNLKYDWETGTISCRYFKKPIADTFFLKHGNNPLQSSVLAATDPEIHAGNSGLPIPFRINTPSISAEEFAKNILAWGSLAGNKGKDDDDPYRWDIDTIK